MKRPARTLAGTIVFSFFVLAGARAHDYEAHAHLVRVPDKPGASLLEQREASQAENLKHARYVARHGAGRNQVWHRKAARWLERELAETRALRRPRIPWYVTKQIAVAEKLGATGDREETDPWPNCPDPYDHAGHSWTDTVNCENGGSWLDSPGYYRCGLQFDPMWERQYGRLCP